MLELQPHMPLFWFHVDTPDPPQTVIARIQSIVGTPPSWIESMWRVWRRKDDSAPPFVGSVNDASFKIQRDIRYRNSFLPIIRGRVIAPGLGSRVAVLMHIHPLAALFMGLWFYLALRSHPVLNNPSSADFRVRGLFFIFDLNESENSRFLGLALRRLLQCCAMADWRQIQARIRKAKNAADAPAKLYELYQRTRDAMVAWELALLEEKAERTSEAIRWYTVAGQRFRRADWKKKAEAALTRLGAPLPVPGDEPAVEPRGMAPEAEEQPAAPPVLGEIIDITPSAAASAETGDAPEAEFTDAAPDAADKRGKKRRRGRRGGRGRRRKGSAPSSLPSQAFVEVKPQAREPQPREPMPRAPIPRPLPVPPSPEPRARVVEEPPAPMLPSERTAHGRAGDPALASRLVQLESKLRRLVSSPLHRLDEADEAPAGPGVFLLSDSDQISTYYVESCQTLRVGLGNLSRGGRAGKSGRGGYLGETGLKAKLAEHLGISEAKVNQYLKDHCVVRWIQLDEDAPLVAHFAIAVLRTPLNID